MSVRIRRARTERDLEVVRILDRQIFPSDERIRIPDGALVWLALRPSGLGAGYLVASHRFLIRFGVLRSAQVQGIGKNLLRVLQREANKQGWPDVATYTAWDNVKSMSALAREGYIPYLAEREGWVWWSTNPRSRIPK